jgi:hypothetical protein
VWAVHNPGVPMIAPSPDFPTLTVPPPIPVHLMVGGYIRKERGPPRNNLAPPVSYLPSSFSFWQTTYPGPLFPANFSLPPRNWKTTADGAPINNIAAVLAGLPAPGILNILDSN